MTSEETPLMASLSQERPAPNRREDFEAESSDRIKASASRFKDLAVLESGQVKRLLYMKETLEASNTREIAEKAIKPGIYKELGKTYFVCPKAFFQEDSILGAMIVDLSNIVGAELRVIPTPSRMTKLLNEEFLSGLWFGLFSSTNQKRRRSKKPYELGRTCAFALIVKAVFASCDELGQRALVKDNFFYGNYPGEKEGKNVIEFHAKTELRTYFEDSAHGDLVFGILTFAASHIRFQNLVEKEEERALADHMIPFDQLMVSCFPTMTEKKGKVEIKKVRKPNSIRSSPLYLKDEMDIISNISSPLFNDLGELHSNYHDLVFALGFSDVEKRIRQAIKVRVETLQRFANRTKLRLQAIRRSAQAPTLKKSQVTQTHLRDWLKTCPNPSSDLVADVLHIISGGPVTDLLAFYTKKKLDTPAVGRQILLTSVIKAHEKCIPDHPSIKDRKVETPAMELKDTDYENAYKRIIKINSQLGQLRSNVRRIADAKLAKLYGRSRAISDVLIALEKSFEETSRGSKIAFDVMVRLLSDCKFDDVEAWCKHVTTNTKESLRLLRIGLELRMHEPHPPEETILLEDLTSTLRRAGSGGPLSTGDLWAEPE